MDRNYSACQEIGRLLVSLSARRAWIEIHAHGAQCPDRFVALRKESVDRNLVVGLLCTFTSLSLSARRAWIEIFRPSPQVKPVRVALRKESVDRNCDLEPIRNTEAVALRKESVDRNPV